MQVTVSIIILGMFVLLELGPSSQHFMPLLHTLLPWAMHHRHAVRVPVQVRPALLQYICGTSMQGVVLVCNSLSVHEAWTIFQRALVSQSMWTSNFLLF
jgi:hypothetical protein